MELELEQLSKNNKEILFERDQLKNNFCLIEKNLADQIDLNKRLEVELENLQKGKTSKKPIV